MFTKLTINERKERTKLVAELSAMSRNGWAGYTQQDYQPLERRLAKLDAKAHGAFVWTH